MNRVRTHYDNLRVARNAPPEVIRAAYKVLAQKYHTDANPNDPDAARKMGIINTAYEVLSDPQGRKEHDEWIAESEQHFQRIETPPAGAYRSSPPPNPRTRTVRTSSSPPYLYVMA